MIRKKFSRNINFSRLDLYCELINSYFNYFHKTYHKVEKVNKKNNFLRFFYVQMLHSFVKQGLTQHLKFRLELVRFLKSVNSVGFLQELSESVQIKKGSLKKALCHKENESKKVQLNESMNRNISTRSAIIIIASIFLCSIFALTYIYFNFPELEQEDRKFIKLPWDVDEAKELGRVLEKHKDQNYYEVLAAIIVTYIFLQTFAIPGSISLSILSGFLFPFPLALGLVCFCSATGASFCYLLSHLAGRRLIYKYFPDRAVQYSLMVQKHRQNIFNYILFLRITPFLPNWFINIAAPIVNVPIFPFWLGTFLGVAPPSFVAIQAGQTLQQLTSMSGTWSWTSVTLLAIFSLVSIIPVLYRERLRTKFD